MWLCVLADVAGVVVADVDIVGVSFVIGYAGGVDRVDVLLSLFFFLVLLVVFVLSS